MDENYFDSDNLSVSELVSEEKYKTLTGIFDDALKTISDNGFSACLTGVDVPQIKKGKYADYLSSLNSKNRGFALGFDSSNLNYAKSIISNIAMMSDINLCLLHEKDVSSILISGVDTELSIDKLINSIDDVINRVRDNSYTSYNDPVIDSMVEFFEQSILKNDDVMVVMQNSNGNRQFGMRNLSPEMISYAQTHGIRIKQDGKLTFNSSEQANDFFRNMGKNLDNFDNNDFNLEPGVDVVLPGESKVTYYETNTKNEKGEDITVRLSNIEQNPVDANQYEAMNTVTVFNETNKELEGSTDVFAYDNAYNASNDAVNMIANYGLDYSGNQNGSNVAVNDSNSNISYISSNGDERINNSNYFNTTDSIRSTVEENNIFGNENGYVNVDELKKDNVINDYFNSGESVSLEDQLTDSDENVNKETDEYTYSNDKARVKKLGQMPYGGNSQAANINVLSLCLYLIIDFVAIAVGTFFLLH